jgi:L-alanine-DL-glutamate epimerase-like enolase superfamily enzyme
MKRKLTTGTRIWNLKEPFLISRGALTSVEVIIVHIEDGPRTGRGEGRGVPYHGETPGGMLAQIEAIRGQIEAGATRDDLMSLLPAGGARNALDAALWDVEAARAGTTAWHLAGMSDLRPIVTTQTIGIRSVADYEERARSLTGYQWLKVKVGRELPLEAIAAVRRGAPHARLVADPNQAWTVTQLEELAPALVDLGVALVEQPVPALNDEALRGLDLPLDICADEAADTLADLPRIADRYDFVNIKLDKAGGLTAALDFARAARASGLKLMAGCMTGSSLAMAPALVLAQLCDVVDLDGPLLLAEDWPESIDYDEGRVSLPRNALWGGNASLPPQHPRAL